MKSSDIVITGVGMVSSIGVGREAFTQSLLGGVSGVRRYDEQACSASEDIVLQYRCEDGEPVLVQETAVVAGLVDFDAKQFVTPRKALKVMSREIQTAYAASQLAVLDAGLQPYLPAQAAAVEQRIKHSQSEPAEQRPGYTEHGKIYSDRIGTVFGSELLYGPPLELSEAYADSVNAEGEFDASEFGNSAMRHITPLWLLKYLPNMPACHYSIVLNAHGPNNSITVGDASGAAALIEACGYLHREIADFLIVSASGTRLNATRASFTEDQPLATVVDPISRTSRPHAIDADGLVRGEGAGGLVLERADTAAARGAKPIARVIGFASRFIGSPAFMSGDRTSDIRPDAGRGSTHAIIAAIRGALDAAEMQAEDIGAVVGHAAGDPVLDACERAALEDVVPDAAVVLPASLLGHTGAASGMMGLLAACVMLQTGKIPPVPHAEACVADGSSNSHPLNVSDQIRDLVKRVVLVISHTSPGHATAVILAG
ncbi:beta-ketoacyl-[acyl-carrier-protein] synthase family protein [Allorhodopirellula heiligendammensis]|uniref:3-oxoacyl-[acyl-carrier-protein] synthase 2 n=1 Tax=Allorhodopirellula heiligendammensis TaxID=2714739 RepID=A0A5C6C6C9_9BACT|nr:beta-ketoacyl synthase N-terminal-like domain-containing protein [Allorhodopirellula heiligendammensis]TWU18339.1 3-oxoacyl-[acyl-carrier-protein] synthase 2 [Allorhodopirellula heiligendammensis]